MKYLLDTHVFIWSMISKRNLSNKVKTILNNEPLIYVSTVALWEISVKFNLGKLELEGGTPEDLHDTAAKQGFKFLPMTEREAAGFYKLERLHKDAFDRMIIWQAIKNNMVLLSKDSKMIEYKKAGLELIW